MYRARTIASPRLSVFPERRWPREGALDAVAAATIGVAQDVVRALTSRNRADSFTRSVVVHESGLADLSDQQLLDRVGELRVDLRARAVVDKMVAAKCFALIREASERILGMRPHDVQVLGAYGLLRQKIVEIRAGEGKTLTATMPAATMALAGVPVHVVTVNDYLAERDAKLMSPLYRFLGLSVGTVTHGMTRDERRSAYDCDITYCTNKELAFDYLRDRVELRANAGELSLKCERMLSGALDSRRTVLRGLYFAIIDEADSVLIDEARTPLIISRIAKNTFDRETCELALTVARALTEGSDYTIFSDERRVTLTKSGCGEVDAMTVRAGPEWRKKAYREEIVRQALTALHLFHRDHHYLLREGAVKIVDEYTGRIMEDRFWSNGLHQLIEVKEGCQPSDPRETVARMTYQRFFRRYCMLSGMSGTIREVASEIWSVYRLPVTVIPPNRPPAVGKRPDVVCVDAAEKWQRIAERTLEIHKTGAPVLIGTRSVDASRMASNALDRLGLGHIVLNAEQSKDEADVIAGAGAVGAITVATNMAGRGTDIRLAPGADLPGGLHVIMSERHDSRRVDRQLAGRCGRQGEPGHVEAILALDDEMIVTTGIPWLIRLCRSGNGNVRRMPARIMMRLAQRRAESLHYRMRKDLLSLDQVTSDNLAFSGRTE